jgi:hypothetical protein
MSKLTFTPDFETPFSAKAIDRVIGRINGGSTLQQTAASATGSLLYHADFAGYIGDLYAIVSVKPAAGESMQFDLLKNGVSVLGTAIIVNSSNWILDQIYFYSNIVTFSFKVGDLFTVTRTYTAGGSPTPLGANSLFMETTHHRWQ